MKKTVALIDRILALCGGGTVADSQLRGDWFRQMQVDGVLIAITHGSRKSWRAVDERSLRRYVADRFAIADLEQCRQMLLNEECSRAEMVAVTGDSKFVPRRTFTGFLAGCYEPIEAQLGDRPFTIFPAEGSFLFIYEYSGFIIPPNVIVIGIENAENFRHIREQRPFFEQNISPTAPLLFVSRYPQNGDLAKWLQTIPNRYVHFGDLDLAGIHIYLTEFYKYLGAQRASFLIPKDFEERISIGSRVRYDEQYMRYRNMEITDRRVLPMVNCINRHHRGYDQEGFIPV